MMGQPKRISDLHPQRNQFFDEKKTRDRKRVKALCRHKRR